MENVTPISKTSVGDFRFCEWFWFALRVLKRKKEVGIAAMNGINAHDLVAKVIKGELDLQGALDAAQTADVRDIITATNTWWPLETLAHHYNEGNLLVEETVYATKTGKRVKTRRSAAVMGIIDMGISPEPSLAYIDDWKSGKWESDDPFERDLYAGVIGPALFPNASTIVFTLRFMRSGNVLKSTYQFSSTKNTVVITDPSQEVTVRVRSGNPFLEEVNNIVADMESAKPIPRHGAHCKKHYGSPCQFYADATCPYWEKKLKES